MYSASHEESATTLCFWDCQLTGLLPRKKITPVVLFLSFCYPSMIRVAVAGQLQFSIATLVCAAVIRRPGHLPQKMLYCSIVVGRGLLHEPAQVPNGK